VTGSRRSMPEIEPNRPVTATVLARALVREGLRNVAASANAMSVKKGIEAAVERVSEELSKQGKDVETKQQIASSGWTGDQ
jgi:chaperonin GroEL